MMRRHILSSACALLALLPALSAAQKVNAEPVRVDAMAERLGVKTMPNAVRELDVGQSTTTMLAEPVKLEPYGIKGMHEGARVTITCIGPNRVRVEADEYQPVERRAAVTLRVSEDGSLTVAPTPDRPPPPKPPTR